LFEQLEFKNQFFYERPVLRTVTITV